MFYLSMRVHWRHVPILLTPGTDSARGIIVIECKLYPSNKKSVIMEDRVMIDFVEILHRGRRTTRI